QTALIHNNDNIDQALVRGLAHPTLLQRIGAAIYGALMAGVGVVGYISSIGIFAGKIAVSDHGLLSSVVGPILCIFVSTGFLWFGVRVMRGCMGRDPRSHPKPVSGHDFSRAVQRQRDSASRPSEAKERRDV